MVRRREISHGEVSSYGFGFRPSDFGFRILPAMRLGTVIGRVTLSVTVPALQGARWLIVSPFTREHFQRGTEAPAGLSNGPRLGVFVGPGWGAGQDLGCV